MPFIKTIGAATARGFGFLTRVFDPFFEYVTMLLPGNGTNAAQNNTFLDSSTNNFTITRNGNTTQGTISPYGTNWSNYFDGTGDYIEAPANAAFAFGTGDFTVETWMFFSNTVTGRVITNRQPSASLTGTWSLNASPTALSFSEVVTGEPSVSSSVAFNIANQWAHIAVSRQGSTLRLFVNGVTVGSGTFTNNLSATTQSLKIGGAFTGETSPNIIGYISNVRIVKGTSVYTADFAPPTAPLTNITNTSLLTCQSNRFIDNSSNNFTITRNGNVAVQRFSPFSSSTAYNKSGISGSAYFNAGTTTYLTAPSSTQLDIGANQFTIEAWVYVAAYSATFAQIAGKWKAAGSRSYQLLYSTAGAVSFAWNAGGAGSSISGGTIPVGAWTHVAVSRDSSNAMRIFVNGAVAVTSTITTSIGEGTSEFAVGTNQEAAINNIAGWTVNGYISNLRVVIGSAVYTAAFTPPNSPVTAITNTKFLLNSTNAGIIDNAMMNDLETVGNAQISTTQSKFGGSSMYFDGTGDWLLVAHTANQFLGTGNFTIECWLYLGATGAIRGIVGKGTGTTGWLLSTDASNKVVFTYASSTITSTGALSGSTWYHLAVVREGTGTNQTKIYINGTNDGTGTVSTDFNQTNAMYVGANRTGGNALNGYIDDLRITRGIARYTANFTAPKAPFPIQ